MMKSYFPWSRRAVGIVGGLLLIGLTAVSLLAFWLRGTRSRLEAWSDLGQAFGTVSAALSAVALIGVVASLNVQRQQIKIARLEVVSGIRSQLLQFAVENPRYLSAWGYDVKVGTRQAQEYAYISMVFSYMKMAFMLGVLTELELTYACRLAFAEPAVASFWTSARHVYLGDRLTPESMRFADLVDGAFAERAGEPVAQGPDPPVSRARRQRYAAGVLGLVAGGVAARAVWRGRRRRHPAARERSAR